jgi:class 3 adenylate cyclase
MAADARIPEGGNPEVGASTTGKAGALVGERRIVTALFCDVVNSTSLAERLDPEEWTEFMNGVFQVLTAPVQRYEGTVGKLLGDGMLAFFGAPTAHEDDPQRAVLAALDMMEGVEVLRPQAQRDFDFDLKIRIGINTGHVVVADVGGAAAMETTAMGEAVNVAARMEQTAKPGTIQISGDTYHRIGSQFEIEALGEISVKGKTDPVPIYRVHGLAAERGRDRGIAGISAPLTGRDREFQILKQAADQLRQGRGSIVCLIGEAGLGKSRLLAEFKDYWFKDALPQQWQEMAGIPYDASRPFGLFQNYARGMFGVELDDTAEEIHRKVVESIRAGGGTEDAVALCSVAFERVIAAKVLHEAKDFPTEVVRQDIYDQMYPGLRTSCLAKPTVIVIDDLQWADPASVDLLLHLMKLADEVPVLIVCAFRPERQSPAWQVKLKAETDYPHRYQQIELKPLGPEDTDALVSALLQIADLPPELRQLIMRKADGNPYFVEEIVRTLIEQGVVYRSEDGLHWSAAARIEDISIPDNLQSLLMARIDRLDQETKSTLQMAAVIGRSFYQRVLKAISDSTISIDKHLTSLERVELLSESSRLPELEYMFKHELARDAAYATILNRRRREFHQRVGEAIEKLFPDRLEEFAHRLARHFELAGDWPRAMKYYELAGDVADSIHAPDESAALLAHALEAAGKFDAPAEIVQRLGAKQSRVAVH